MFSPIFLSEAGASSATTLITVAIVALVCLLCAEIIGIYMLVSKLMKARNAKKENARRHYGMGVILLAGIAGQAGYTTLIVLSVLVIVGALGLVGLLAALRVMGYEFVSSRASKKKEDETIAEETEEPEEFFAVPVEEEPVEKELEEEPVEEVVETVEETVEEEPTEDEVDTVEEDDGLEKEALEEPSEEAPAEPEVCAEETVQPEEAVALTNEEQKNDGQPYRVVEKIVTETVKEVYKEAPQSSASTNDAVVEKLVDLLDYELRTRRELELADAAKKAGEAATVAAFAAAVVDEDEDDDDDTDETENAATDSDDEIDGENDPDSELFTGNERIIGFDETTGCYIVAHYRKSFEAKLIQARPNIKQYYSELKNALLSYKGSKNRISWTADSFHNGRTPIAKINVKTRILEIYLALDPASLEGTVYRGKDVGDKKKYADTPFQYKIRTPRKFKWAMELVQRVCEEKGLTPIDIEKVDYEAQYPFDTTENLVERKLIKEYIRQEKPATTFELDPDHVPETPEVDETVIPANANFSWEFDNERMVDQEPDPIPEPEPEFEPAPAEEILPAEQPQAVTKEAPASDVVRETVKVTEMRYTERYYSDNPDEAPEIIVSEPIEVPVEPVSNEEEPVVSDEEVSVSHEEAAQEEIVEEDDPLRSHEVIYADDDSYGADTEYAPVVAMATEEDASESAEEDASLFEDDEPVFGNAFEEVPYEEAPFEDALIAEDSYVEDNGETFYEEDQADDIFYSDPNEDEPIFVQEDDEPIYEEAFAEEYDPEEPVEAPVEEEPEAQAEPSYTVAYGESYGENPFEETYAHETQAERPTVAVDSAAKARFNPSVAVIDICSVEAAFRAGEVISLETLKERNLVLSGVSVLKIYTSGPLRKAFTVEANQFTVDAIRAISDAHGDAIMVR